MRWSLPRKTFCAHIGYWHCTGGVGGSLTSLRLLDLGFCFVPLGMVQNCLSIFHERLFDFLLMVCCRLIIMVWFCWSIVDRFVNVYSDVCLEHCQRHNGPEGWVLFTKVSYFSRITRWNTKFDQISSSEYWPSTKFKISTSASRLNLKFKILTKPGFRISTKIQLHYLYKTSAAKHWRNSSFKSCLNFNF